MVKKRTIEARTKTQTNNFPNNKPVFKNESSGSNLAASESNPSCTISKSLSTSTKASPFLKPDSSKKPDDPRKVLSQITTKKNVLMNYYFRRVDTQANRLTMRKF